MPAAPGAAAAPAGRAAPRAVWAALALGVAVARQAHAGGVRGLAVGPRPAACGAARASRFLGLAMLPALVHWGPGIVPDYLRHAIAPSLRDEVAPAMNQSLDAFLSRLLRPYPVGDAAGRRPVAEAASCSAVLSVAIAGVTLRGRLRRRRPAPGLVPGRDRDSCSWPCSRS